MKKRMKTKPVGSDAAGKDSNGTCSAHIVHEDVVALVKKKMPLYDERFELASFFRFFPIPPAFQFSAPWPRPRCTYAISAHC